MTQQDRVRETLRRYDVDELMTLVNSINSYDGGLESQTWRDLDMSELCGWLTEWSRDVDEFRLKSLIYSARTGEFSERHDYWRIDEYGYPVSTDYPSYDIDEIAEYIAENSDDLHDWCLSRDMEAELEAALEGDEDDRENTTESDSDEDSDGMTLDEIAGVLADWYDDRQLPAPTDDALDALAQFCALTRPADPVDVVEWVTAYRAEHTPA
ncbi:MAG: hypothetical protein ACI3XD_03770 [Oscillospiraceae bacterium]